MRTDLNHWMNLCAHFPGVMQIAEWHARLMAAYAEPQRAYHTLQHLEECLAEYDRAIQTGEINNPLELECALWFHDAVYDPQGSGNEEKSAELALEFLAGDEASPRVTQLVLLTRDHRPRGGPYDAWMADIDLSIFGQDLARVREYEYQIRQEYSWVDWSLYREKRLEILASFLARERLYQTAFFHKQYEDRARSHLRALIAELEAVRVRGSGI
ncbi:hypothetical protein WJU23_10675 [Prosthecobacter sp. SYSU 5D2]|uniref:HD domain-containing protein n=1 Tax=Prosthecobacter sp. SYSU 5D2 TaxID=3134134 RepID=UPI0031FF0827